MFRNNINLIKQYEGPPVIEKLFSLEETERIRNLYNKLPLRVFNQKQNIKKKAWIQSYDKELDKLYFKKLKEVLGDYKMDNLKNDDGTDLFGLYHESFHPLGLHVDSGFIPDDVIYKQVLIPLTYGETIFFKNKWYGRSTTFTIDPEELNFKPNSDQNDRSKDHLGNKNFDTKLHQKYMKHIDIKNLQGLEIELVYKWKVGEVLITDRTHIHCSSSNLDKMKLALTTFTKK